MWNAECGIEDREQQADNRRPAFALKASARQAENGGQRTEDREKGTNLPRNDTESHGEKSEKKGRDCISPAFFGESFIGVGRFKNETFIRSLIQ
jgi:hypothetical protein